MNNLKLFTISQIIHNSWHQTYNSSIWACSVLFGCVVYQKLHSSLYSFQNLNEIVWKKSEKFGYEAQPSIQIFHDFWRLFHENSEKCTRMSAISDKHNDWTEPRTSCLGQARNPHVMEVIIFTFVFWSIISSLLDWSGHPFCSGAKVIAVDFIYFPFVSTSPGREGSSSLKTSLRWPWLR